MAALVQNLRQLDQVEDLGEDIVYEFRPSFARSLFGTFGGVMLILIVVVTTPLLIGPVIALVILPIWYMSSRFTNYTLTSQRIKIKRGLLIRREDDIELYRIKDVKSRISLLNRLVGIGTVNIISSERSIVGVHPISIEFKNIKDPSRLREILRKATEEARRVRGVRELDVS